MDDMVRGGGHFVDTCNMVRFSPGFTTHCRVFELTNNQHKQDDCHRHCIGCKGEKGKDGPKVVSGGTPLKCSLIQKNTKILWQADISTLAHALSPLPRPWLVVFVFSVRRHLKLIRTRPTLPPGSSSNTQTHRHIDTHLPQCDQRGERRSSSKTLEMTQQARHNYYSHECVSRVRECWPT